MDLFVLHEIGWVIYVYYLNLTEENIWRNNFKRVGLEVLEDLKSFSHPGQHVKMSNSDVGNYVNKSPSPKQSLNKVSHFCMCRVDKRFEGYRMS